MARLVPVPRISARSNALVLLGCHNPRLFECAAPWMARPIPDEAGGGVALYALLAAFIVILAMVTR
jgi:hypothetical protein